MKLGLRLQKSFGPFCLDVEQAVGAHSLGVLGPSGSGKSTLLNCMAGLVSPDRGRIELAGRILVDTDSNRITPVSQRGLGYVFQDALLFPHLSVERNLRYGLGSHGHAPEFEDVVRVLELDDFLHRDPTTLSGGQARRVAIGRALLSGPRLLLLDEPLSGLDRTLAVRTLEFLRCVMESFSIPLILVSHSFSDAMYLCDEAWILADGKLIAQGSPRSLLNSTIGLGLVEYEDLCTCIRAVRSTATTGTAVAYRVGTQEVHCSVGEGRAPETAILSIHADDVILARERPSRISARNILSGRVASIAERGSGAIVQLQLEAAPQTWLARLTPAAIRDLQLLPESPVFMIIKASSIGVIDAGRQ